MAIYALRQLGYVEFPNPDFGKIKSWTLVTIVWLLPILCNMNALQHLNIETVMLFRTMTCLGVALGDSIFLKTTVTPVSMFGLLVITLGGIVYGTYDVHYNWEGYMWSFAYWASMVFNGLYIKVVFNQKIKMSTWEKSFLSNLMTVPILAVWSILKEDVTQCLSDLRHLELSSLSVVVLSCVMGLGISVAGTRCREVFSATGFDVLGNMNKFVSIILSRFLLATILSPQSLFGLVVSLIGGIIYSPLGMALIDKVRNWVTDKSKDSPTWIKDSPTLGAQNKI